MGSADHPPLSAAHVDIFFVPAPERVVAEMLRIAQVDHRDVVMDLGSGNGQILLAAARVHGARGIGVEIDRRLVAESRCEAARAGLADRLEFFEQDLFQADLRPATVLMLYLLDSINVRLRPRILAQCLPGTRVVSYSFEMDDWPCDAHTPIAANGVSLWIVPANLSGEWRAASPASCARLTSLALRQHFQELAGSGSVDGASAHRIKGRVRGTEFTLTAEHRSGLLEVAGRIHGDLLEGVVTLPGCEPAAWQGERVAGTQFPLGEERQPALNSLDAIG